ncbi:MAG TPA: AAA family ATPase [Salegentibacter sp.]|uniref:ATP-dependent nuclease n=1 Tax=Salegentibacter sp. TaxID=1903072 RepID=UPI002F9335AC
MNLIKEINIKYFRSIYHLKLKDLNDCIIFSGKNDVGKSNILKALNLFFNNETDWHTEFSFYNDFNFKRLSEVREKSIKGKQYIQIEITFRRGSNFQRSLPSEFTVRRTWDRNSRLPKETTNLDKKFKAGKIETKNQKIVHRSLTQFFNKVKFEYVPAIKDRRLFSHLLNELQTEIFNQLNSKGREISKEIKLISDKYSDSIEGLKDEFKHSTGINSELALPVKANELFKVLNVLTDFETDETTKLNLDYRGDGIRLRYIPSLYNYLAKNHRGVYILGFEEPENSMEYGLGSRMAEKFFTEYSKNSQILITSHSPAFLDSKSKTVNFFRIYRSNQSTLAAKLEFSNSLFSLDENNLNNNLLTEELGLTKLQLKFHKLYEEKLKEAELTKKRVQELEKRVSTFTKPILYTEGITDVTILKSAWKKLYPDSDIPYEILPVQTTDEGGGDGGYASLNRKLESVKDSEPLQIGLYDYDSGGFDKGFNKLNKNFSKFNGKEFVQMHKNQNSFAMVIPEQPGLEDFYNFKNLPIEFLFSEQDLNKEVDGRKLELSPYRMDVKMNGVTIDTEEYTDLQYCSIKKGSKKHFAEKVVPSLETASFENFKLLFSTIDEILNYETTS